MRRFCLILPVIALMSASLPCWAQAQNNRLPNPVPYSPEEPLAKSFSLGQSAKYLDTVARFWMKNSCGDCHANFGYLMARPMLREPGSVAVETRRFLEKRLELTIQSTSNGGQRPRFQSEIVGIAAALAFDDAQTTGRLQPTTRQALDHMWTLQIKQGRSFDGTWRCGCGDGAIAVELDPYLAATMAALAAGTAPDGYAQTPQAQDGLTRLRRFFMAKKPEHLHHRTLLLWASLRLDGLMTSEERRSTIQALLSKQEPDGGWNLGRLEERGADKSDGYATGLAVYVLRQAGLTASRPEIVRGVRWLQDNQRRSGGWFTVSHHVNQRPEDGHGTRELSVLNATTAFAAMALAACQDVDVLPPPHPWLSSARPTGLALRRTPID